MDDRKQLFRQRSILDAFIAPVPIGNTGKFLLEKVKRDKEAEGDFREGESSHFVVRYHGGASRQLASEVTRVLEDQFAWLQSLSPA